VKQDSCGTNTIVTDGLCDGLGRTAKELQLESGSNKILRETQYDFAVRAFRTSNPTRAATATEWTETQFDSVGRVTRVTTPDGAATVFEPVGHQTTITDAATKRRQQTLDAFGRITQVIEDPGGSAQFATNYRYSLLDDLLGVCQGLGGHPKPAISGHFKTGHS
jgi:uncharacterized protein RhaS with RHS repeats